MERNGIKIGFAATRRGCFEHPEGKEYREKIKNLISGWGAELVDIDSVNDEGLLFDPSDVPKAVEIFKKAEDDGVFIANCNFGEESVAAMVAKEIGKPILLWGPRDGMPVPDQDRTRDTQCGLFALGKALRRYGLPFTYIPNTEPEDPVFERGYKSFVAVCSIVKNFRSTRILQISTRPQPFWSVICNEGELVEKFGIEVFPVTIQDVKDLTDELKENPDEKIVTARKRFEDSLMCGSMTDEQLMNSVRLYVAVKELCRRYNCNSVAIHCWGPLQKAVNSATCTVNSLLTEEGIPVACETDIHGAITSIILQSAVFSTKSIFFADLTIRHPENDNAELLWHCGNFPPSLAKEGAEHRVDLLCQDLGPMPTQNQWEIRHGDITVCRFDGDHGEYQLLIGEGRGVEGPKTRGTYSWFEVNDWPMWEEHIVKGPYIHHCAGVHDKVAHILYEACKYIGVKADPISPTKEEIEAYWRGR